MKAIVGLFLIWAVPVVGQARNVRVANDGLVVATQGFGGLLVQRGAQTPVEIPLPPSVANFDDISIDRAGFLFALSTLSRAVCSYSRGTNDSFSLVGCVAPPGLGVSPFTQMSAIDGVCVVSGGTAGMTILDYDVQTGQIESSPRVLNRRNFPSILGAPGVRLLNGELAALSTDFRGPEFGTVLVDLESLVETRSFFVRDTLAFSNSLGSTNFPIGNAFYEDSSSGATTMYTANGGVTAQDPFQDGAPTVIIVPTFSGGRFRAVSVDVDQERDLLVVGGFLQDSMLSIVLQYDVSGNPLSPALLSSSQVAGRVTSVGANAGVVAYVGPNVNGIGRVAPPTPVFCFPSDSIVDQEHVGPVKMASIKLGDKVLTRAGKYETVYSFGHYAPNTRTAYLQFHTNQQPPLEMSANHMVFLKNGKAVPAGAVKIGDSLLSAGGDSVVKRIAMVERTGAYAPFTASGSIVVNGVVASNYVALDEDSVFGSHWVAHLFQAPHRLVCQVSACSQETYDQHGLSWWVATPLEGARWFLAQEFAFQLVLIVLVLPVLIAFEMLAQIGSNPILFYIGTLCVCLLKEFEKRKGGFKRKQLKQK